MSHAVRLSTVIVAFAISVVGFGLSAQANDSAYYRHQHGGHIDFRIGDLTVGINTGHHAGHRKYNDHYRAKRHHRHGDRYHHKKRRHAAIGHGHFKRHRGHRFHRHRGHHYTRHARPACHEVYKIVGHRYHGRQKVVGTQCYDRRGRAYIVPGSRYVVGDYR